MNLLSRSEVFCNAKAVEAPQHNAWNREKQDLVRLLVELFMAFIVK